MSNFTRKMTCPKTGSSCIVTITLDDASGLILADPFYSQPSDTNAARAVAALSGTSGVPYGGGGFTALMFDGVMWPSLQLSFNYQCTLRQSTQSQPLSPAAQLLADGWARA